jgi:hypothetical protein
MMKRWKDNSRAPVTIRSTGVVQRIAQKRKFLVLLPGEWYIAHEAYFYRRRSQMDALIETSLEPRKEWVTPELKKIDIAIITAIGPNSGGDSQQGS